MRELAESNGIGYVTRGADWTPDMPRHAKAGNLNNALMVTSGEFLLILDADQIPEPDILDKTLGYFNDDKVALVQTPQYFINVPADDPLGSQAPLFYGPIQQGKDGWNAAFFCGSNAILRREALMQLGLVGYVKATEKSVRRALAASRTAIKKARRSPEAENPLVEQMLNEVEAATESAQKELEAGASLSEITYRVRRQVDDAVRTLVAADFSALQSDLEEIAAMELAHVGESGVTTVASDAVDRMSGRDWSPLGALESVHAVLDAISVERTDEAQPIMPLATISVTEDMATAMRMHGLGWKSVYHHEILALRAGPRGRQDHADPTPPLGPRHHAGPPPRKPAGPAQAHLGPAAHVLLHHVDLPERFRCRGLFRSAHHLPDAGHPPGEQHQLRLLHPFHPVHGGEPTPVPGGRPRDPHLARAAVQPRAVPHLDQGLHDGGTERLVRTSPRVRGHPQSPAERRTQLEPDPTPDRGGGAACRCAGCWSHPASGWNVRAFGHTGERGMGCVRSGGPERSGQGSFVQGF